MFKNIKFVLLTLCFLFVNSYLLAESKLSFIDVNYIYNNSNAGKKINNQIKEKTKKINDELSNYQKKIEEEKIKLNNQKNILSKDEFVKQARELEKKVKEFNVKLSKNKNELKIHVNKAKNEFYLKLTKIVQDYAVSNSIEMILKKEDILMGKKNLDITKDIMNLFNKEVKIIKVN